MALRTDIKEVFQKNTGRKARKVVNKSSRITPNNKWKVYTIDVYVKNE
tara:strand:- start:941 stop:1084 length:144 start_codon:yes stop_codon:yes gene_type:complete